MSLEPWCLILLGAQQFGLLLLICFFPNYSMLVFCYFTLYTVDCTVIIATPSILTSICLADHNTNQPSIAETANFPGSQPNSAGARMLRF